MTEQQIQRVLGEHFVEATGLGEVACRCDHKWQPTSLYRAHVAAKVAEALAAQVPEDWRERRDAELVDDGLLCDCDDYDTVHISHERLRRYAEAMLPTTPAQVPDISARVREILDDPNGGPVEVGFGRGSRHMHAEPICAHPSCQTYLAPDRMALERIRALLDRPNGGE